MAINKIVLIGGGVLAEQIIHAVKHYDKNSTVIGFIDDTITKGELRHNVPCMGSLKEISEVYKAVHFDKLFISIGYKYLKERKTIFELHKYDYSFYTFIHPDAYLDVSAKVGDGSFISAGVHLEKDVAIGENVFIYNNAIVCHDSIINSHTFISPAVSIAGYSVIGECCMLGIGTVVIDHITIGDFIRTGGGTIIVKDLTVPGTYIGNPAKEMKKK
jgi:sugar O-acyltransferase (sialic acid O-acetyltransferase NeuD family)